MEPKPGQEWNIRDGHVWRRARIVNVLGTRVELTFLDRPGLPDVAKTVIVRRSALGDAGRYRLASEAPLTGDAAPKGALLH